MGFLMLILLFIIGACFGSFLCCQARRLHHKETGGKKLGARSVCLNCGAKLKWYDNLPIISWLVLKGKCRNCGKKIGLAEILSEVGLGLSFSLFLFGASLSNEKLNLLLLKGPILYLELAVFFLFVLCLGFLAIYDGLYKELPVPFLIISIVLAVILNCFQFSLDSLGNIAISTFILGGLYLLLYLISKGKWVGDGDWLLGVAIGLVLKSPWLALITLFLSNLLALLVMLPVTKGKNNKIPFGPFLVAAFFIVFSLGG